jgi:hypothetical protein
MEKIEKRGKLGWRVVVQKTNKGSVSRGELFKNFKCFY